MTVELELVAKWLRYSRTRGGEALTSAKMAAGVLERDGLEWFQKKLELDALREKEAEEEKTR